jgi:nitrite reductase/ring-hydroxylating ferredoxin subunit
MAELLVGKISDFRENDHLVVTQGDLEIGVIHRDGNYYAYRNLCVHQGGPACEGIIMAKVEDVMWEDKTTHGQRFSEDEIHFVCPWHGFEYDLKTGEAVADRRKKLRSYDVVKKGDSVYVIV